MKTNGRKPLSSVTASNQNLTMKDKENIANTEKESETPLFVNQNTFCETVSYFIFYILRIYPPVDVDST